MGRQRHRVQIVCIRQFSSACVIFAFHLNAVLCWSCVQLFQQIVYVDIEQECRQWSCASVFDVAVLRGRVQPERVLAATRCVSIACMDASSWEVYSCEFQVQRNQTCMYACTSTKAVSTRTLRPPTGTDCRPVPPAHPGMQSSMPAGVLAVSAEYDRAELALLLLHLGTPGVERSTDGPVWIDGSCLAGSPHAQA